MRAKCFAETDTSEECFALRKVHPECGTTGCPFFKPEGCKSYIRTFDNNGKVIFRKGDKVYTGVYK